MCCWRSCRKQTSALSFGMRLRSCCVRKFLYNSLQTKSKTAKTKKAKTIILNLYFFFQFPPRLFLKPQRWLGACASRWYGKRRLVRIFLFRALKYATKQRIHAYFTKVCSFCGDVCVCAYWCSFVAAYIYLTWNDCWYYKFGEFLNASNYFAYAWVRVSVCVRIICIQNGAAAITILKPFTL